MRDERKEASQSLGRVLRELIGQACTPEEERLAAFGVLDELAPERAAAIRSELQKVLRIYEREQQRIDAAPEEELQRMQINLQE